MSGVQSLRGTLLALWQAQLSATGELNRGECCSTVSHTFSDGPLHAFQSVYTVSSLIYGGGSRLVKSETASQNRE